MRPKVRILMRITSWLNMSLLRRLLGGRIEEGKIKVRRLVMVVRLGGENTHISRRIRTSGEEKG
jgi:hypothetical protein